MKPETNLWKAIRYSCLEAKNGIGETDDTKDRFGLMPYLSEDGSQNVYILNVTRYHGLSKN